MTSRKILRASAVSAVLLGFWPVDAKIAFVNSGSPIVDDLADRSLVLVR